MQFIFSERRLLVIDMKGATFGFTTRGGGGGLLPHMGYICMCRCEGYGFQAVCSSIGYIN